jgi:hypothetical protein
MNPADFPKDLSQMQPLQIKRTSDPNVDPKQALRAHIDELPIEKQHEFVAAAFQLMGDRIDLSKIGRVKAPKMLS